LVAVGAQITDRSIERLPREKMTQLVIQGTAVTDRAIDQIAQMPLLNFLTL
jgi:hypothetical protein